MKKINIGDFVRIKQPIPDAWPPTSSVHDAEVIKVFPAYTYTTWLRKRVVKVPESYEVIIRGENASIAIRAGLDDIVGGL